MNLTLELARPNQFETGLQLYQLAAQWLADNNIDQWHYWLKPDANRRLWIKEGFLKKEFYFARHDNHVVGMFRAMSEDLLYWGNMPDEALYIHSLIVAPDYRKKKLGAWLLNEAEKLAHALGKPQLRLDCVADNTRLCTYYESQGFKKVFEKQMPQSRNAFFEKQLPTMV